MFYVEHGNVDLLKETLGLDSVSITEKILKELEKIMKERFRCTFSKSRDWHLPEKRLRL